jgi:CheY-like chemotaxis protein
MNHLTIPQACYEPLRILLYSSNVRTRDRVTQIIGSAPDPALPTVGFVETATQDAVLGQLASGRIDLVILDGEASPAGGLGIARQLKDELLQCPPVVVLIGRADDGWLARWSCADGVVAHPIDPVELTRSVVPLLRARFAA